MKILYISQGQFNDYQCDMLFHGLRSVLGSDAVDVERIWNMYADKGGGYSVYGLLPDDSDVDRSDISNKIRSRYFDAIIYGSIWHSDKFLPEVLASYPSSKVAFIDGLDDDSRVMTSLEGKGLYFKREPSGPLMPRFPIQFAIPKEKIREADCSAKIRLMAPLIPGDFSTYGYTTEESYYQMYASSYFGRTWKKGGWDCLRHYEIMAAGCLPYFVGLESCPPQTLEFLPKSNLSHAKILYDTWGDSYPDKMTEVWQELMHKVSTVLREHLTTEALAKRVLEKLS